MVRKVHKVRIIHGTNSPQILTAILNDYFLDSGSLS